jgi:hypothetical protein
MKLNNDLFTALSVINLYLAGVILHYNSMLSMAIAIVSTYYIARFTAGVKNV